MMKTGFNPYHSSNFCKDDLRKAFSQAVKDLDIVAFRDLCIKHNPQKTFNRFEFQYQGRRIRRIMHVVELIHWKSAELPESQVAADMFTFARVMGMKALACVASASLLACLT